jgi:hypothetical protein
MGGDKDAVDKLHKEIVEQKLRAEWNGSTSFKLTESFAKDLKPSQPGGEEGEGTKLFKLFASMQGDAEFKLRPGVMMVLGDPDKYTEIEKDFAMAAGQPVPDDDEVAGTFILIKKGTGLGQKGRLMVSLEKTGIKNFNKPNTFWAKDQKEGADVIKELAVAAVTADHPDAIKKSEKFIETAEAFFKPDNNAIVRSFNATKGKGLAGFITTLSFDYSDSTWEMAADSRAPKTVGLTMVFAPVHDVPLGIDYEGRLRSLSHPVGKITQPADALRDPNLSNNFGGVYDEPLDNVGGIADYDSVVDALEKTVRRGFGPEEGPGLGI